MELSNSEGTKLNFKQHKDITWRKALFFVLRLAVFKFMEQPENNEKMQDLKRKVKFKIMSLKVKEETEYAPELVRIAHTFPQWLNFIWPLNFACIIAGVILSELLE